MPILGDMGCPKKKITIFGPEILFWSYHSYLYESDGMEKEGKNIFGKGGAGIMRWQLLPLPTQQDWGSDRFQGGCPKGA